MENKKLLTKLKEGHWPIFLLSNISSVANLLLPIFLVRLLSPEEMGVYKTFFLYIALIPFLVMAGGPLNSVYYWMGKGEDERKEYIQATWLMTTLMSALIFIPALVLFLFFRSSIPFSPMIFWFLIVSGFLVCPSGHFCEVCIAEGKTMLGSGLGTSFELIKTLGFIVLAYLYRRIDILLIYFFVIMALSMVLMLYLGIKTDSLTFKVSCEKCRDILNYSLPISLSALLLFLIEKADLLIISEKASASTFAFYSLGCLVVPPLFLLEMSVQKHLIPKLSRHFQEENYYQVRHDYRLAIRDIAYLVIPAVFGLFFFARPIVHLLYTVRYDESIIYLKIFAFSYLVLMMPQDSMLRASGKTSAILKVYLMLAPFSLLILYFCVKHFSLEYVLAISLVLKFIPQFYCFLISAKIAKQPFYNLVPWKNLFEFTAVAAILTAMCFGLRQFFVNEVKWFIVCAPMFAIIYLGLFILKANKNKK